MEGPNEGRGEGKQEQRREWGKKEENNWILQMVNPRSHNPLRRSKKQKQKQERQERQHCANHSELQRIYELEKVEREFKRTFNIYPPIAKKKKERKEQRWKHHSFGILSKLVHSLISED